MLSLPVVILRKIFSFCDNADAERFVQCNRECLDIIHSELPVAVIMPSKDLTEEEFQKRFGEDGLYKCIAHIKVVDPNLSLDWLLYLPRNLKSLRLNLRRLNSSEASAVNLSELIEVLKHFKLLKLLDLSYNSIGRSGALVLFNSLDLRSVEIVNLSHNHMWDEGVQVLAKSENLFSLKKLYLSSNSISDEGASALANSPKLRLVEVLDLSSNGIGDEGVRALTDSPNLKSVNTLDLSSNRIGNEGARALAEFPNLRLVEVLDLSNNDVGSGGKEAFTKSPNFHSVKIIDLDNYQFLETNLFNFELVFETMTKKEVQLLSPAKLLRTGKKILNLSGNMIGTGGAQALASTPYLDSMKLVIIGRIEFQKWLRVVPADLSESWKYITYSADLYERISRFESYFQGSISYTSN